MKIERLLLENVTSYERRTEFIFDAGLNIFIGPNGGGKSNLQKTIAVILTHYFIHQWQVKQDEDRTSFERTQTYRKVQLKALLATYGNNEKEQVIEIELMPERHDLENINAIGANLEEINKALAFYEKPYSVYEPLELISEIKKSESFTYQIIDRELVEPDKESGAYGFLRYLNDFFIFMRVANSIPEITLSAPVFFFTSERALTKGFEIQAGQLTEDSYISGYQTAFNAATGQTNLLQWGSQHFVRLYRRSLSRAGKERDAHFQDFLRNEPDVVLLDRYLAKLGYGWDLEHDEEQTKFRLGLTRGGMTFFSEVFSSGEREIIHFLVAMFALNVRDGLILVDEPELHLHPRWQRMFLRLFRDLVPERNNQFIIATHSPVFVSPETIHSVVRVYREPERGSNIVALRDMEELPSKKQLVRMINSQNNERLFFADKVILVEGISDRVIIGSLIDQAIDKFKDSRSIEVVDVGGKGNFASYQKLLQSLKTPWGIVADRDYLEQIGSAAIKGLFETDVESQARSLVDDKKSIDRKSLLSSLKGYLEDNDKAGIQDIITYIDQRHRTLKAGLSDDEKTLIDQELEALSKEGVELLRHGGGEVEDYMPERLTDIGAITELVSDNNWIISIENEAVRVHLAEIVCRLMDLPQDRTVPFVEKIRKQEVVFQFNRERTDNEAKQEEC